MKTIIILLLMTSICYADNINTGNDFWGDTLRKHYGELNELYYHNANKAKRYLLKLSKKEELDLALPKKCKRGDVMELLTVGGTNGNGGSWRIYQQDGQSITFWNTRTTMGIEGFIGSTDSMNNIILICTKDNTDWEIFMATGNIEIN